ncbi:MAG: ATPase [Actinobacteria bacterium 69-20]|nr:MAG: ATPase [Actinobacteria bacterium 69-20]
MHIVTGKGGTGKTTVAAAMALALARDGKRVLLVEVEERQAISQLFDLPPLPYEERRIAVAPGGGEVRALAIDVEAALLEYFAMFYNLGFAARSLKKMGAVEFATTLAPGLRDVLLTGKIKETVTRRDKAGRNVYDAVVVDAPPTGRIVTFLNVTIAMADLARRGPIRNQADGVVTLLHSPDTCVHVVTLLEDMPVTETIEAVAELRAAELPVGTVVINRAAADHLPDEYLDGAAAGELDVAALRRGLQALGVEPDRALVGGLAEQVRRRAVRTLDERRCRADVAEIGLPMLTLPALPDGVQLGEVFELADALTEQGVRR